MNPDHKNHNSALASARKALMDAGIMLSVGNTTLEERQLARQKAYLLQCQSNLEEILRDGLKNCGQAACDNPMDPDWLNAFLPLAEKTSNRDMQKLWALIFAKEASVRGSFSIRSLRLLSEMTRKDAEMFQRAVALGCQTQSDSSRKIIFACKYCSGWGLFANTDQHQLSLNQFGLPYSSLLWLMEHGLIHNSELETSSLSGLAEYKLKSGSKSMTFQPKASNLKLKYYRFTPVGDELARLISSLEHPDYQVSLMAMLSHAMIPLKPSEI